MPSRLSRRALLSGAGALASAVLARPALGLEPARRSYRYRVDLAILFDLFSFAFTGTAVEEVDHAARRYRVNVAGEGPGLSNRVDASGIIRNGRFLPIQYRASHTMRGRESKLTLNWDYGRGVVEYHATSYTLLLGRLRQVDDVVPLPPDRPVDDVVSAGLNFAANRLEVDAEGHHHTMVVRRARREDEGPDEVASGGYHAEIVPFRFHVTPEGPNGRLVTSIDMTRWSSWAMARRPARVVFTPDRHVESVDSPLILGSAIRVKVT